ncbi:MAG: endonuclease MutS2 [Acidobacteria bacterium]|nr:endonuclease MutS2 [Acidobacteriota bacterium]
MTIALTAIAPLLFQMHAGTLRVLEFDRIVHVVCGYAQTPMGAARLAELAPLADPSGVARALAATAETAKFLGDNQIALRAPEEFHEILRALDVEGRLLDPAQLVTLSAFLASVDSTAAGVRRARAAFPILRAIADIVASFENEIADVRRKIDPAGEVVDDASAELRGIRDRLRKQRTRLRGTLESYLRGKDTAKYLQQQIVTDRNGRYVLVVRSEHRSAIPGIVHGSSGSGASLFLEPLSTVEINNDIVALEQQEAEEVRRILLALTDAFRRRGPDLEQTITAATEFDVLQARAQFSLAVDGIAPKLAEDGRLELRASRHPLMIPAVRRRLDSGGKGTATFSGGHSAEKVAVPFSPVPVDILLIPPVSVLVITGPNTGGKTVALKTAGLHALMAQAGLLIPAAEGSQVPVFKCVFADIGDEQSISASLSTFSAHIRNVVEMHASLDLPALVLLDEAGAGTDPIEGGALAMAMIDQFRKRGAKVVATTHYDSLKTYAATTDGVVPAGFGFDPQTFAPTFRLNYGSPGSSLALEIAARLGMPAGIIEQARSYRSERETQLAEHLARVEKDRQSLEHEHRLAARERHTLEETAAKLHTRDQDLKNREETFRRRLNEKIEERLRDARREIDAVVEDLKGRTEKLAADAERRMAPRLIPTGQTGAARSDARAAIDQIGERLRAPVQPPVSLAPVDQRRAAVGDRVMVGALGLDELRVVTNAATVAAQPSRIHVNVDLQPRSGLMTELNLIGNNVDEALTRLERFLDESLITETKTLRIIHGYGTGQLRRAVADFLKTHPLVANYGPAPENQGAGGATVVELKD